MVRKFQTFGRRTTAGLAVAALLCCCAWDAGSAADAGEWMFRRSYYSHLPPAGEIPDWPVPESRTAYRRAWMGTTPGLAMRGAQRYNTLFLRSGPSVDVTIFREGFYEMHP